MQTESLHNQTPTVSNVENEKTAWHRPSVNRIDIKRTLGGVGSATDGASPTS